MILNTGQQAAFDRLTNFVLAYRVGSNEETGMILLSGVAGTGKTTVISRVVEHCMSERPSLKFAVTAPTNKAVKILRSMSKLKSLGFSTLHSLLGLVPKKNPITGVETFEAPGSSFHEQLKIRTVDVLILDEASMLNSELFMYLMPYVVRGLRIIFVGDGKQIPPVGEKSSIPFSEEKRKEWHIELVTLDKIVRQSEGNPIIKHSQNLLSAYSTRKSVPVLEEDKDGVVSIERDIEVIEKIVQEFFCTPKFSNNANYAKIIAWRNSTVKYFNTIVRNSIFGDEASASIVVGEKLVVDKPILDHKDPDKRILFTTSEELVVTKLTTSQVKIKHGRGKENIVVPINVYIATVTSELLPPKEIYIVHETSKKAYDSVLKLLADNAKKERNPMERKKIWQDYWAIQDKFAKVIYNYCITAHKSQGSTYDNVLVQEWDIFQNFNTAEMNSILYTACTRAKTKLYIVK